MAAFNRSLFVARLPWTACHKSLTEYFSQYGKVESSRVMFDMKSGRSRKFGFVFFEDPISCENAIAGQHFIDGHKIAVEMRTKGPRAPWNRTAAESSDNDS